MQTHSNFAFKQPHFSRTVYSNAALATAVAARRRETDLVDELARVREQLAQERKLTVFLGTMMRKDFPGRDDLRDVLSTILENPDYPDRQSLLEGVVGIFENDKSYATLEAKSTALWHWLEVDRRRRDAAHLRVAFSGNHWVG